MTTFLAMLLTAIVCAGCGNEGAQSDGSVPAARGVESQLVMAAAEPVAAFVRRIAGDAVAVECPIPADADPGSWTPNPEQVARYQSAGTVFLNGGELEQWTLHAPMPRSRLVELTRSIKDRLLEADGVAHSHGAGGSHTHGSLQPEVWLNPVLAIEQARVAQAALRGRFPESTAEIDANAAALIADLRALDARLRAIDAAGVRFVSPHSEHRYLADEYGWDLVEPGDVADADTGASRMIRLIDRPDEPVESTNAGLDRVLVIPARSPAEWEPLGAAGFFEALEGNVARIEAAFGG